MMHRPGHRGVSVAVVMAITAALAGCGEQWWMARDASAILRCPSDKVAVVDVASGVRRADGCGHSELYVGSSLRGWIHTWDLRQRAAFDLSCPVDALTLTPVGDTRSLQVGVVGCGHRAVYTYVLTSLSSAAWTLDSTSTATSRAGASDDGPNAIAGDGSNAVPDGEEDFGDDVAHATETPSDPSCAISAADGHVGVTVSPGDDAAFSLMINGPIDVRLGGERDGRVEVSAPLAFSATLSTRGFVVERNLDLVKGMVHIDAGSWVTATGTVLTEEHPESAAVRVTAHLSAHVHAEVAGLIVACADIGIRTADDSPTSAPPTGRAHAWAPRTSRLALRERPSEGETITLAFGKRVGAVLDEIDRRGRYRRVLFHAYDGWVVGWADERDLATAPAQPPGPGGFAIMPDIAKAPPGGYAGPAHVGAGTLVYSHPKGTHPWARIPEDVTLEVVAAKDARWVELTGLEPTPSGGEHVFAYGIRGHAWVLARDVQIAPALDVSNPRGTP